MTITIRNITRDDVVPLISLLARYFSETIYAKAGLERDWDASLALVNHAVDHADIVGLVCEDEGKLVGTAYLCFERSWFKGTQCLIENFMIVPGERNKGLGIRLRDECLRIAKERGVNLIRTSAESGFDDSGRNNALYERLWDGADFVPLGRIMVGFPLLDAGG